MRMRPWLEGFAVSTVATVVVLGSVETLLRSVGFRYAYYPIAMRYVSSIAQIGTSMTLPEGAVAIRYTLDHAVLWRPVPQNGVTNSEGFLGPEWSREKRSSMRRMIALGDSCTAHGDWPYPALLAARAGKGSNRWEVWNAGVGSWSSFQGRRLLETRLLGYRPDVVSIYFGWNDHWLSWSVPDRAVAPLLDRQWRILRLVERSRLLQALLKAATLARRDTPRFSSRTPFRVSLEDYEANLRAMVALVRSAGGRAVLVTAPSGLTPDHPVTRILCEETHNFFNPARIVQVHDAYNERVRRVARETETGLVDLAVEFDRRDDKQRLLTDGIHLSREGHALAADLLAAEAFKL
ncbi:MAG: SGNH/GDSL hydrolase family protein [Elusimicrobiota bacterium]